MRLDRNKAGSRGKYAVVNLAKLADLTKRADDIGEAAQSLESLLERLGRGFQEERIPVHFAKPGSKYEFFVLMLKDIHSEEALEAYADSVEELDAATEIRDLAKRAGRHHPNCKQPD